jgi:pyruvate dehydrogenase E2 component (dihydrolipoamide acetyltransferase)
MATEVKLPRLGQGMESGTIVRWLKAEGDAVKKSEPLYELDTDKVTQEVEAEAEGVLLKILVTEGEVEVGATVAVIGTEGEEVSLEAVTAKPAQPAEPAPAPRSQEPETRTPPAEPAPAPAATSGGNGRVKASPLARRMARERGIDLSGIAGTGPDGRIVAEDVEKAASGAAPAAAGAVALPAGEIEVVTLTSIRRTIARRLSEAWQAPVFQLGVSADMTEVLALREKLLEWQHEGDVKPTVNDVLTKLVGVALGRHRAVNATFDGEQITRSSAAHVGMAVAAPNGLVVPVIRDADRRTIQEIAHVRADLVGRAREGRLALEDMQGGTFTISNLGMFGVEEFVAVLNPPQVAILAVGAVKDTPVVVDGEIDVAPVVKLVLTCDHRAIDGADGAQFLQTLVTLIEQPGLAL